MTTFLAIVENSRLEFVDFKCKSSGKLEQVDGKFLMTEILLEPTVTIVNKADKEIIIIDIQNLIRFVFVKLGII